MHLKSALPDTYPLLKQGMGHYTLQLNGDNEIKTAQELEKFFNASYQSYSLTHSVQDSAKSVKTLTQKALEPANPRIALIGLLYLNELQRDFTLSNHQKKLAKPFDGAKQKFQEFFQNSDTYIRTAAAKSLYKTDKHLTHLPSEQSFQKLSAAIGIRPPS